MTDDLATDDKDAARRPSRVRSIVKEVAILAFGLVVLFAALGFLVSMLGWSMCCQ